MMNSKICELLDIEFPLVAFTHCRDVVVAVLKLADAEFWEQLACLLSNWKKN